MRLVGGQGEHDEVGVVAIDTVPKVWRIPRLAFAPAYVLHHLQAVNGEACQKRGLAKQATVRIRARKKKMIDGGRNGGNEGSRDQGMEGWAEGWRFLDEWLERKRRIGRQRKGMKTDTLCSPSPGTSCPERMISGARHMASVSNFDRM